MGRIEYITAGESHGPALTAIITGLPAGFRLNPEKLAEQMQRRQSGFGRGGRMKIESDQVEILSGLRGSVTLGSPLTLQIRNRDFANWAGIMDPFGEITAEKLTSPRPGHADYAGMLKYETDDIRNILERASARETAIRTAAGAVCRQLLEELDIRIHARVLQIGTVQDNFAVPAENEFSKPRQNDLNVLNDEAADAMKREIQSAMKNGDSLGGIFQVLVYGLPVGLGSHTQWNERISSHLARHIMGINALKGIDFGSGFASAAVPGSGYHDEFDLIDGKVSRLSNHAGGQEGGMSNGEVLYFQAVMKAIPTLARPLQTIDMATLSLKKAFKERTDSCAVPAASVVAENVTAIPLLNLLLSKYGGDSMNELKRHMGRGESK